MVGEVGHHNMCIIRKPRYVKTLYDAWIPEFGSGMDPDPAGFRVVGSGPDPAGTKMSRSGLDLDPAGSKMSRSGLDPDPAGSENCGSGAPLLRYKSFPPSHRPFTFCCWTHNIIGLRMFQTETSYETWKMAWHVNSSSN